MKNWNYKVVKMSRGGNGEWFSHPTAATFEQIEDAKEYARKFHAEQQASLGVNDGHKYCVLPRRKSGESAVYRLSVPAADIA